MILPPRIVIGNTTYSLRKFQSGPGHDWLRRAQGPDRPRSANAEVNALVDEIIRLRDVIAAAEQETP